jgi:Flp pilus assembly protein TadD
MIRPRRESRKGEMRTIRVSLLCILTMTCAVGCQADPQPVHDNGVVVAQDLARDTDAARKYNKEAMKLIQRNDLAGAETKLQAAIKADPFYGPAHNSLGIVYLRQKNYYEAAGQFDKAGSYMPRNAVPRNNMGLVLEVSGKLEGAAKSFEEAAALDPSSIEYAGNLARAYVRLGRNDDRTRQLLSEVAAKDTRPDWVSWARERLMLMGASRPATSPAANE